MWILQFLPDWIFHLILLAGLLALGASAILKFIPFVTQYRLPIQAAGAILTVLGIYMEGAMSNEAAWQARVKEMELKVAAAEVKSAEANTKLVREINKNQQLAKDTSNANKQTLSTISKDLDSQCRLPRSVVMLHNSASQNQVSGSTAGTATGTSEVKASELIGTVTDNYGTYYQLVEQVKGWQTWYKQQKQIFEEIK